jgi:hypothetical protein
MYLRDAMIDMDAGKSISRAIVQNNLEINSDMKSALNKPPVHSKFLVPVP